MPHALLAVWLGAVSPLGLSGHPFTLDQANDAAVAGGFVVYPGRVLAQEFVPTMSSLEVVELMTNDQIPGNNRGTDLQVRIRAGGINGPILGASVTLSLPDGPATPVTLAHFDFPAPVPLTPGRVHVIQVVAVNGDNRGIFGTGWRTDGYPAGNVIVDGGLYADPDNAPFDLWFREGPARCAAVDLANERSVSGGFVVPGGGPVGQEFVPGVSSVDMVELMINDQSPGNGTGADLFVRLRSGNIAGPILGTSATRSLPDRPTAATHITRFDFPVSVPLTPGAMHVLEVVSASGDNQGVFGTGWRIDSYPAGSAIFRGAVFVDPENSPFDLWFRLGRQCMTGPRLSIERVGDELLLEWTTLDPGLVLHTADKFPAQSWTPVSLNLIRAWGSRHRLRIPIPSPIPQRYFQLLVDSDPYRTHVRHFRNLYGKSAEWQQWMFDNRGRYEAAFQKARTAPAILNIAFRYETTPIAYSPAWTSEAQHMSALEALAEAAFGGYAFEFIHGGDTVSSYANVIAGTASTTSHALGKDVHLYYETIFNHEFAHVMGLLHHYDTLPDAGEGMHMPPGESGCILDRNSNQFCSACRTALRIPLNVDNGAAASAAATAILSRYPY